MGELSFDFAEGLVVGLGIEGEEKRVLAAKWQEFMRGAFTFTVRPHENTSHPQPLLGSNRFWPEASSSKRVLGAMWQESMHGAFTFTVRPCDRREEMENIRNEELAHVLPFSLEALKRSSEITQIIVERL